MTQLMLFDSPSSAAISSPAAIAAAPVLTPPSARSGNTPVSQSAQKGGRGTEVRQGLNHMGDLARLVLLRYELAAKRRERMRAAR